MLECKSSRSKERNPGIIAVTNELEPVATMHIAGHQQVSRLMTQAGHGNENSSQDGVSVFKASEGTLRLTPEHTICEKVFY
jgi:hypothetical protein